MIHPATLKIGKVEWSIEVVDNMAVHILDTSNGRSEGEEPIEDFILVDRGAHRICLIGDFDWWNFGEVIIGLMQEAAPKARKA